MGGQSWVTVGYGVDFGDIIGSDYRICLSVYFFLCFKDDGFSFYF